MSYLSLISCPLPFVRGQLSLRLVCHHGCVEDRREHVEARRHHFVMDTMLFLLLGGTPLVVDADAAWEGVEKEMRENRRVDHTCQCTVKTI